MVPLLKNLKKMENVQIKKKLKTIKQKRKKPNWWSKSKRFFEKPCNKSITIVHF